MRKRGLVKIFERKETFFGNKCSFLPINVKEIVFVCWSVLHKEWMYVVLLTLTRLRMMNIVVQMNTGGDLKLRGS